MAAVNKFCQFKIYGGHKRGWICRTPLKAGEDWCPQHTPENLIKTRQVQKHGEIGRFGRRNGLSVRKMKGKLIIEPTDSKDTGSEIYEPDEPEDPEGDHELTAVKDRNGQWCLVEKKQ